MGYKNGNDDNEKCKGKDDGHFLSVTGGRRGILKSGCRRMNDRYPEGGHDGI